jgi:hypothetical protein
VTDVDQAEQKRSVQIKNAWPPKTFAVAVPSNLLLGYFALPPLGFAEGALNIALKNLGLPHQSSCCVSDETAILVIVGAIGAVLAATMFFGLNRLILAFAPAAPGRRYWPLSALVLLAPLLIANLWDDAWRTIGWY